MPPSNHLSRDPPFAVQSTIEGLGANLRRARLRRNITIDQIADRLGVGRHVVMDAENGKITTGIVVYVGMLWVLNLLPQLHAVAEPSLDMEGMALAAVDERERASLGRGLDNDF